MYYYGTRTGSLILLLLLPVLVSSAKIVSIRFGNIYDPFYRSYYALSVTTSLQQTNINKQQSVGSEPGTPQTCSEIVKSGEMIRLLKWAMGLANVSYFLCIVTHKISPITIPLLLREVTPWPF